MEKEGGFTSEMDLNNFVHKDFVTYRKSINDQENMYFRYNPFNLVNTHHLRTGNNILDKVSNSLILSSMRCSTRNVSSKPVLL